MSIFNKPSRSINQQIADLKAHGFDISDTQLAEHWLQHVSYYRLSGYWLPFELPKGTSGPRFVTGTQFETAASLYEFDRRLRLLMIDAIERLEVAFRGSWAYQLAQATGPHGYLNASLYTDRSLFHSNFGRLARDVGESRETFMKHYRAKYDEPVMPPVWMVAEIMSLGQLSRWYALLDSPSLRNAIAKPLGLHESVFVPFVRHLATVRNTCAHHGRLWNRRFLINFKIPNQPTNLAQSLVNPSPSPAAIYNTLVIMIFLIEHANPGSGWRGRLKAHLKSHPTSDAAAMGFPVNWESMPMWR